MDIDSCWQGVGARTLMRDSIKGDSLLRRRINVEDKLVALKFFVILTLVVMFCR